MANEKRLIDANEALRMIKDSKEDNPFLNVRGQGAIWQRAHNNAIDCVNTCPTVDAVEVVRCKDCQYAKPYKRGDGLTGYYCQHPNSTFLYGTNWERLFEPVREVDDFCSYGERREGE